MDSRHGVPTNVNPPQERAQPFGHRIPWIFWSLCALTRRICRYWPRVRPGARMQGALTLPCSVLPSAFAGAPAVVMHEKKTFRQNNYFNLVLLCFKTNPLRSDSGVLKYYSHWDLAPIEFGRYSLTTRVLIEALENTSGQFHYLMALGFPNAS